MAFKPRKFFTDTDEMDPARKIFQRFVQEHIARANRETVVMQQEEQKPQEPELTDMFLKKQAG